MKLLIKKTTVVDPHSSHNGKIVDILIRDGIIKAIRPAITEKDAKVLQAEGSCVSIGWMDIGVQTGDPGYEYREDLTTVAAAAAAGGYTAIACQPNTIPVVDSKSGVLYVKNETRGLLTDFFSIGAISRACEGKDITEMLDMHASGAIAFSDGKNAIQDSGLMLRALQYVKAFEGIVINQPHDSAIASGGQMNEGLTSTTLGMVGIPHLAEELMVQRDIYLAEYTTSRVHIANISTAASVELIRKAKAKDLQVSASVAAINLAFDDGSLSSFDVNFKVLPPLRSREDIDALKAGLKDGTIDMITSNHVPLEEEAKKLEFPFAEFGAIGLETTYALCNAHLNGLLSTNEMVEKLAINPRKLLKLGLPHIESGQEANLTLFDPAKKWTLREEDIRSKSKNTPLIGMELKGRVLAVFNKHKSAIFRIP